MMQPPDSTQPCRAVFHIVADADAGSLPRISGLLSLANVAPASLHSVRRAESELDVCALLEDVSGSAADLIHRKLSQLTCVHECCVEILT
jgi:hypothetical protein